MTNPSISISAKDQLDIAVNGSQKFHQKIASWNGNAQEPPSPDPVLSGHIEMSRQLSGLADLLLKTAECVAQGYPAKLAVSLISQQQGIPEAYQQKIASTVDDLALHVLSTIQETVPAATPTAGTVQKAAAVPAVQRKEHSPQMQQAWARGQQLMAAINAGNTGQTGT